MKKITKVLLFSSLLRLILGSDLSAYEWPKELQDALKKQVVNVSVNCQFPLSLIQFDNVGSWSGK